MHLQWIAKTLILLRPGTCFRDIQSNFNGSNTGGSFTRAVSNSFLSTLEKII